ncbi:MAG TPA: porin [Kofleriaceae bacterium]|nr:porin [Kofleriaceae bacterium]
MRPGFSCAVLASALAAGGAARADVTLNFFGDINYSMQHDDATSNTFQASTLDVFATQTEGKFSFIGEMIIEADGTNEFSVDIDRLEVAYKPTPWLHFRAGRLRSAFGYYGDAYQNGKYFMTPVSWPLMYEGNGFDGIVPSHSIGVHGDAAYGLGEDRGKLTLDVELLNGRGTALDSVPVFHDDNNSKAVNLRLRYVGDGSLAGLVVGGNVYVDDVPAETADAAEVPDDAHVAEHELVLGGHAAYVTDHVHLIGELAWFRHRTHDTHMDSRTLAMFGEAGYSFGDVTPYARYEYTHFYEPDPYFVASGIPFVDIHLLSAGVKYAASASVAVKLEGAVDLDTSHRHVLGQAAFAF